MASKIGSLGSLRSKANQKVKRTRFGGREPEFVVIFHPGKGVDPDEIRAQFRSVSFKGERIQFYMEPEEQDKEATLISPFGTFTGKQDIEFGISTIKSLG